MATELNIIGNLTHECWHCGEMRAAHFCEGCGKVQPPAPVDYFLFFGLPRKLDLDAAALEREYYRLSRKLHPDLYAKADDVEQQWSVEKSSRLNDAFRTLKDPVARTQYLLSLEGVQLEEQSSAATLAARESGTEKKQVVPPELLEEVFELNMQLQELRMGGKDPEVVAQLTSARQRYETMLDGIGDELKLLWKQWDTALDAADAAAKAAAKEKMVALLNRRSYVRNLVRDVNEAIG